MVQDFSFINSIGPENLCFKNNFSANSPWKDPKHANFYDAGTIAEGSDQERDILAQLPLDQLLKVPISGPQIPSLKIQPSCRCFPGKVKKNPHLDRKGKPECGFPQNFPGAFCAFFNIQFQGFYRFPWRLCLGGSKSSGSDWKSQKFSISSKDDCIWEQ